MLTSNTIIHEYPYYKFNDLEGKGIAYAYENDDLLISFISNKIWKNCWLIISQESLTESVEIQKEQLRLRNCFDPDLVKCHYPFIQSRATEINKEIIRDIKTGEDLWNKKGEIFSALIFCESLKESLFHLTIEDDLFKNLIKKFTEFQFYFSKWAVGDFDKDALTGNVRLENDTRIREYKNQFLIKCPNNEIRLFSLHCNVGVWGYRMHFFPDTSSRTCIIGYIGKKIGT